MILINFNIQSDIDECNSYGIHVKVLLVSDRGRLWLLDVDESAETAPTPQAKWLAEFRERHVLTVACGADFSAVLVQDQAAAELPADVAAAAAAAAEDDVDDGQVKPPLTTESIEDVTESIDWRQVEGCWVRSCPDCRRARQLQPTLRKDEERRQQQQQQQQQEQKSQEQQQQQQPSLVTDPKDDANTLAQVENGLQCPCSTFKIAFELRLRTNYRFQWHFHRLLLLRGQYSRIRLYHPPPDRTKVADISGSMIKPVGPNSSSKCQLYCENNQIR